MYSQSFSSHSFSLLPAMPRHTVAARSAVLIYPSLCFGHAALQPQHDHSRMRKYLLFPALRRYVHTLPFQIIWGCERTSFFHSPHFSV